LKLVRNSTTDAIKVAHTIFVEGALLAHKVTSLDRRTQDLDTTYRVAI
jgi:dynactin complex subunit